MRTAADLQAFLDERPHLGALERGLFLEAFDVTDGWVLTAVHLGALAGWLGAVGVTWFAARVDEHLLAAFGIAEVEVHPSAQLDARRGLVGVLAAGGVPHMLGIAVIVTFIAVHLLMVMLAGPINEIRSMITGRYVVPPEAPR